MVHLSHFLYIQEVSVHVHPKIPHVHPKSYMSTHERKGYLGRCLDDCDAAEVILQVYPHRA